MKKYSIDEHDKIKEALDNGYIIAIPTDTIYGVATNIENYQKIIDVKNRDNKPLVILCSTFEEMQSIINIDKKYTNVLINYIPGALTIVGKTINPLYNINKGFDTTGVRVPNHSGLLELLKITGPLVVSSANVSGEDETYYVEDVYKIFKDLLDLYVDNNEPLSKQASAVLNIDTLEIYRDNGMAKQIVEDLKNSH